MSELKRLSTALVVLQFVALGLTLWPSAAQPIIAPVLCVLPVIFGALVGVLTLAYNRLGNFNIVPEVKPDAELITTGPYRWVRHPMYSALLLFSLGSALYFGGWINTLGWVLLLAVLFAKSQREERLLAHHFDNYTNYKAMTRRFIPFIF